MTNIISRPAALVKQGNLKLYTTSLKVSDLLSKNFYDIERLDPDDPDDKGFQRVLNKARSKRLADYILDGQATHDAFLPTSVFLATDGDVEFNASTNTITFDVDKVGPFSVVDGQHRIEGLKLAAEKNTEVLEFEVPVNIAVNLPKIAQMCHFLIVNTTQKSVDRSVEQRIYARLTEAVTIEDVPSLPKWIRRIVESGDDGKALKIVDYLNATSEFPWYGKIEMANNDAKSATVSQSTFVKALTRYVLTASNPIFDQPIEKQQKIFLNYWKAISAVLDVEKPTVLYKSIGLELFCRFSMPLFYKLHNVNDFKVTTIEKVLVETFENLDGEFVGVGHPDWWLSGTGAAGRMNSSAIAKAHSDLTKALHKVQTISEISL